MKIPSLVLRQLYTNGSLMPTNGGVSFSLKNRLVDAKLTGLHKVTVDGNEVAAGQLTMTFDDGATRTGADITSTNPVDFPLSKMSKAKGLRNCWVGLTIVHRSGIFSTSDILGNVFGGSDWLTAHWECIR